MSEDFEEIYLEPDCCADHAGVGRTWCQDDVYECEHGVEPTRYVRADIFDEKLTEVARIRLELESENRRLTDEIRQLRFDLEVAKERERIDNTESHLANARIKDLEACLEMSIHEWKATMAHYDHSPNAATHGAIGIATGILKRDPAHAEWGAHEFNQCCSFHRDGGDSCAGCWEPTSVSDRHAIPNDPINR